jgi:hypothetical protein
LTALLYRLRADLRTGWRSLAVIAFLVGLSGGAVLDSLAAARRTDTAFSRMRRATNAWDVMVNPNNGSGSQLTMAKLRAVPGVERIGRFDGLILFPSVVRSVPDAFTMPPIGVTDRDAGYTVGRPVMTAGHLPGADDPNGVMVGRTYAREMHLRVGQTFKYVILTPALLQQVQTTRSNSSALAVIYGAPASQQGTAHIDGIGVMQDDVVVDPGYVSSSFVFGPGFRTAHPKLDSPYWGAMVKLRPGTSLDAFTAKVRALAPGESIAFQRAASVAAEVDDATSPQVMALEAFAALAALLGLVVVAQALSRRMQLDARYNATLAALGASRPQRAALSLAKATVAIVAGAALAVGIAYLASPLGPVGAVRVAEVHPGLAFDGSVLILGAVVIVVAGTLLAIVPAWRSARVAVSDPATSRSRLAAAVSAAGGSLPAVVGIRFGIEPGAGRTSVPVRTTLLAAATAVALVTSVVVFSASLDHLLGAPRLYGSAWDGQIELDNLNTPGGFNDHDLPTLTKIEAQFERVADRSGSIAASALVPVGEVRAGAVAIPAIGYRARKPGVAPTIAEGRFPRAADEVALGATTMARLHTRIGGTIELAEREQGPNRRVKVVGRAVLPGLAPYPGSDKAGLGVGALFTWDGWARFSPDFGKIEYIFHWAPHSSTATLTKTFAREMPSQLPLTVSPVNHPAGVTSLERLRSTPTLLASLVAILLAAAVANALVMAVRRRRRDLAVLRTLGFTTRQVLQTVLWQASTVGVVAVVVGIPAGLILGRWTWTVLADRLGAIPVPAFAVVDLAIVVLGVLVLANLVGLIPGWRAAHTRTAAVLRAE